MDGGAMDREIIGGLINSISRLIHLVACQTLKSAVAKDFGNMVRLLKLLKVVLDDSLYSEIPISKQLVRAVEELDLVVNMAREIMEKRPQRMSKICSVLQTEPIMLKVQNFSLDICNCLSKLQQSSCWLSHSSSIQKCMQELQCEDQVLTSELIEIALKDQRDHVTPNLEDVKMIMETLGLTSNQELLMESITLEKERIRTELKKKIEDTDHIYQIIGLVTHIRHCLSKVDQFGFFHGLPIPSYFRCPLSLELMLDPVILASGQTYERSFIQKWLDNGLRVCPKTRLPLEHINLIPNYTVKALIANWCEENNIRLCDSIHSASISQALLSTEARKDSSPGNSFHGSLRRESSSRSSVECVNQVEMQKAGIYSEGGEQPSFVKNYPTVLDNEILQQNTATNQQSSCHSKSESMASTISSTEISSKFDEKLSLLGEATYTPSMPICRDSNSSQRLSIGQIPSYQNGLTIDKKSASSFPNIGSDVLTTSTQFQKLVEDLMSQDLEVQAAAASELRLLAKHDMENRILIAKSGAIGPLVSLLYSKVKKVQENAVTALLNLSINDSNKILIAEAGALEPLIYVLESGNSEARENSAATLFSLSALEEYKAKIGRSGAVKALVNLLAFGSARGKKDAATALFNLSIFHENKARIIKAGAVKYLVELLDPTTGMADKCVAILTNLSTIPEGRLAIAQEGGICPLVETLEMGSHRGKENAASALFQLCINSQKHCSLVLQEGAVPPLIALSQFGTPRAKEKAQQILGHLRSQREGGMGKVKS